MAGSVMHAATIVAATVIAAASAVKTAATHVATAAMAATTAVAAATAPMTKNGDGGKLHKADCEDAGHTPAPRAKWIVL